ncbi:type II secretion system protein GspD [Sphingomonas segetis]|jgi:general secretion pathway protein D|uniref:type II secretion system protein GspD n=1 Tax=Sphingomonas segetis TaxID=1104779 RepID=UPI0012D2B166|nr:secretin N-terminal domain-containing protein [Sphingomonas segetis]
MTRMAAAIAVALLSFLLCALPAAAAQQVAPVARPALLTDVKLLSESPVESRFELTFDPAVTAYGPSMGAPNQPAISFPFTSRGRNAVQPRGMKGLVRQLNFLQQDNVLVVRFDSTAAASAAAVRTTDRTVEVTVTTGRAAANRDYSAETGPSPISLPAAYEPPEDYALVLLKYADVSEVVGLLTDGLTVKSNDVFIPSEPQFGSNSLTGNNYTPTQVTQAPGANDEPLGQSVDASIGIDRRLNAVWLKGPPERIARLKAMIAAIDIPVDSVILETQFVELTESGVKALGIDFNNSTGQLGVVTFGSGGFIAGLPPQGCTGDPIVCSGHVTSAQFQAALYAQIQKGNGRIVSRPRISAQSGSTAKIITGDALPILTSIALSGVNGVSQQVQYVNVGVTLQIAPRVSGDGFVSSHVFAVVSSVTGSSQGYPTISQREAETSATVRDGDSFVIGGLTQDETLTTKSRVPLLGDIPLLGQAFRNERTTRLKTELYIIITPRIVHRVGSRTDVVPANAALYAPPAAANTEAAPPLLPPVEPQNR